MSWELDQRVRLAAFAKAEELARRGGGLITADALSAGFDLDGERVPLWNQMRGIYRPAVLRESGAALSIHTSFNSPYDDHEKVGGERLVYRYQGNNPDNRDNRALRRAFEFRRPLLYLIAGRPGVYRAVFPCYITADRPAELCVELAVDAPGEILMGTDGDTGGALRKAYATRVVRQRLHQDRFRYSVLRAYRVRCAICRLRHEALLDAAHILPDRDERSQPEVPNGLSLCKIHHAAYDANILGIDPDYVVSIRDDVRDEKDGPMLRFGLQGVHKTTLTTPHSDAARPNRDFLAIRYKGFVEQRGGPGASGDSELDF